MRILIIEDEQKVARFIERGLADERFAVDVAPDGISGVELATTYQYDLIILDLLLPGMDGTQVLRRLRQSNSQVPVLVLTARDAVSDKVENFEAGADDYLTKPFAFAELVVRVKALLRRGQISRENVLCVGDLELNRLAQQVRRAGQKIDLIAIAGGYVVVRQALRPVNELTRSAERITSRNIGGRLPVARTGDELERLSVALNRMVARLDEAFTHIRRFTADASHELRTPLTVLRGELEAITQKDGLSPELHEVIGSALEETERLSKIVESLLAISHLDAGEARMERKRFDLAELTATTTDQLRQLAEDKTISLSADARQIVSVEGDPARLKQVIVNLLDNAIKYTPDGGLINVAVKAEGEKAILEVSDSGVGIPNDAVQQIFERFYRVDKTRSREMGGTGLGLAIVKSICAAHGGQVNVESREGKGSRFRVELPLAENGVVRRDQQD